MELKIGFLSLFMLANTWMGSDARQLAASHITSIPIEYKNLGEEIKIYETVEKNNQVCTLCEEYVGEALSFLRDNKTQTDIVATLHKACSKLQSLEEQCVMLVDLYAYAFFSEISTIQPEEFCQNVNLCGMKYVSLHRSNKTCELCHQVIIEVITKLKDPDTQFEIIEMLLKQCNKVEDYAQECKRLVLQYGPLILASSAKFFETNDVCSLIHVCRSAKVEASVLAKFVETSLTDA